MARQDRPDRKHCILILKFITLNIQLHNKPYFISVSRIYYNVSQTIIYMGVSLHFKSSSCKPGMAYLFFSHKNLIFRVYQSSIHTSTKCLKINVFTIFYITKNHQNTPKNTIKPLKNKYFLELTQKSSKINSKIFSFNTSQITTKTTKNKHFTTLHYPKIHTLTEPSLKLKFSTIISNLNKIS